jgi:hypothetical protein
VVQRRSYGRQLGRVADVLEVLVNESDPNVGEAPFNVACHEHGTTMSELLP